MKLQIRTLLLVAITVLAVSGGTTAGVIRVSVDDSDVAASSGAGGEIDAAYGKLPLAFEANEGQTDASVDFMARGKGYSLFLTPGEAVLSLDGAGDGDGSVIRVALVGAEADPQATGVDELAGVNNYLIGNDPSEWRTGIPTFAKVRYEGVYPGIDLDFYGNPGLLEYDFIVAPGVSPDQIALAIAGSDGLAINGDGDLVVSAGRADLIMARPFIYQTRDGVRETVDGGYVLDEGNVRFWLGGYDATRALVIDPVVMYTDFLGGSAFDTGQDIAVDVGGRAYVVGYTRSSDFPTVSALDATRDTGRDVFLTRINPAGDAVMFSTFIGGNGDDRGRAIALDNAIYIAGQTESTDFPTVTPVQSTQLGFGDGFVAKLSLDGSTLVYSTYVGGGDVDDITGIDAVSGFAYVAGVTASVDLATTPGAVQGTRSLGTDVFAAALSKDGTAYVYMTYIGGTDDDAANDVAADASGNAYITGFTRSSDYDTTAGSFQPTFQGGGSTVVGPTDAFVTKLSPDGTTLVYSGFLGGSDGVDIGNSIDVDTSGAAHVTGSAASDDFPTAGPGFLVVPNGSSAAFITRVAATGNSLTFSRMLPGTSAAGRGVAVDGSGNIYVTGSVTNADPIFTKDAADVGPATSGGNDGFVTKLFSNGLTTIYSTYFGGEGADMPFAIAADSTGAAYITGQTDSVSTFPFQDPATLVVPFDASNGGSTDGFVSKIGEPGSIGFSDGTLAVLEDTGKVTLIIERTGGTSGDVGATLTTKGDDNAKGGTKADADVDYGVFDGPVSFPDGDGDDVTKEVTIKVDATAERDETFKVDLKDPTGGAKIGPNGTVVITIGNDDTGVPIPSVSTWGLLGLVLVLSAGVMIKRRRRAMPA